MKKVAALLIILLTLTTLCFALDSEDPNPPKGIVPIYTVNR